MANNNTKHPSQMKALERIELLEMTIVQLTNETNNGLSQIDARSTHNTERIESLFQLLDEAYPELKGEFESLEAKIIHKVQVNRDARDQAAVERQKSVIAALVTSGRLMASPTVGENSIVIGRQFTSGGDAVKPGWFQAYVGQLPEDVRLLFLTKAVTDVINLPNGGTFEVLEIYDVAPPEEQPAPDTSEEVSTTGEVTDALETNVIESAPATESPSAPNQ